MSQREKLIHALAVRLGDTDYRGVLEAAREAGIPLSDLLRLWIKFMLRGGAPGGGADAESVSSIEERLSELERVAASCELNLVKAVELILVNVTNASPSDVREIISKHFGGEL